MKELGHVNPKRQSHFLSPRFVVKSSKKKEKNE